MKKNRVTLVIIGVIAIILAVNFLINGFEFSIYGVCCFNSKYYDTPKLAFEQTETLDISNDIGIAEIDPYNVMYFAKTQSGDILAAQMKRKNGRYFFVGNYSLSSYYLLESHWSDDNEISTNCMYNENGLFKGNFEYFITKKWVNPNVEEYTIKTFDIDNDETLYFVYRIVND